VYSEKTKKKLGEWNGNLPRATAVCFLFPSHLCLHLCFFFPCPCPFLGVVARYAYFKSASLAEPCAAAFLCSITKVLLCRGGELPMSLACRDGGSLSES
jgi:hypothetical protein